MLQIHQLNMVLLLSPKYMSSKFGGFLVALKNETPYLRAFPAICDYSSSFAFIWKPFANALIYCICGNRFILIELICICFNPRELILNSRMNSTYPNCQRFNHKNIRLVLRLISIAIYFTYDLTYDLVIVGSVYN